MWHVVCGSAIIVLFAASDPKEPALRFTPGDHVQTVTVGGEERECLIHVPASYDGTKAYPVVLAFHGGGSDAHTMVRFCGLNETADAAGFLAVYPNGSGRLERARTWNAGNCCGFAMRWKVDDVAFVRTLLDDLSQQANVDRKRVYATGMSNGAMICYRLASELSDRIAAIAPVSGPMGAESCRPKRAVPVIHFHGTADDFAPFDGGPTRRGVSSTVFHSVDHSIQCWVKANGCKAEKIVSNLPDRADDGMTSTRTTYASGTDNSEVVLITIKGGGHTWPGRTPLVDILGESTRDFSANDLMWEFFMQHPMK